MGAIKFFPPDDLSLAQWIKRFVVFACLLVFLLLLFYFNLIQQKFCAVCAESKEKPLLRCSRCKNAWYCGPEHQVSFLTPFFNFFYSIQFNSTLFRFVLLSLFSCSTNTKQRADWPLHRRRCARPTQETKDEVKSVQENFSRLEAVCREFPLVASPVRW